jgi:hypothetical protein
VAGDPWTLAELDISIWVYIFAMDQIARGMTLLSIASAIVAVFFYFFSVDDRILVVHGEMSDNDNDKDTLEVLDPWIEDGLRLIYVNYHILWNNTSNFYKPGDVTAIY